MATIGAQPGNQNAKKAKRWQDALNKALARFESDELKVKAGEALDKVAETVVQQALAGNKDAWQEISQRLDGKVPQALIGGDEDDAPIRIEKIERSLIRPTARVFLPLLPPSRYKGVRGGRGSGKSTSSPRSSSRTAWPSPGTRARACGRCASARCRRIWPSPPSC
jgi:hypothetical protein